MAAGVLMVPILEHYALTGVLLTGALLYAVFFAGHPLTTILVIAITVIPVVGVVEQALAFSVGVTLAVGLGTGVLVSGISHALFPDAPVPAGNRAAPAAAEPGDRPAGSPCAPRWSSCRSSCWP